MLPLALILRARGHEVAGSDRSLDAGRTSDKFSFLEKRGVRLHPQDGSGLTREDQILVTSAAVEDTIPDVVAARKLGCRRMTRAELLAELLNNAPLSIAVAGTSGKSTTTGMIGWILYALRQDPTIMNGAVMKNFVSGDSPFASALVGEGGIFVSEVDESDGSIALYSPSVAVLNNISLDHKTMDELRVLFSEFLGRSEKVVLNLDNEETRALAIGRDASHCLTYSLEDPSASLFGHDIVSAPDGMSCLVTESGTGLVVRVCLQTPGRHNLSNGLAALAAARACGFGLRDAANALMNFSGIRRRLEIAGVARDITVIDDFAHNPDKIAATLATLRTFRARLLIMWQPHGFGPLRQMKSAFVEGFLKDMSPRDILLMPEPVYHGGTVDRSVSSRDVTDAISAGGRTAHAMPDREACRRTLLELAEPGDIILIMGARDDTLSEFAASLVADLSDPTRN